jgi:hypothetical protein
MSPRLVCLASVALALAACSYGDVAPAANVAVATTALAPAHDRPCRSDDDCGANHTGGVCMPKVATKELSDTEDFLGRAMSLHDLITRLGDSSSSSQLATIQQRVREDLSKYAHIASGRGADGDAGTGDIAQRGPLTSAQMKERQDAAWMQSGAAQAQVIIRQFAIALSKSPITTDAQKVYADVPGDGAGLHLDKIVSDLQTFLHDIDVVVAPIDKLITLRDADGSPLTPKSGAGALLLYLGPVIEAIHDATSRVSAFLDPSASSRLENDLTVLSQGHDVVGKDGNGGTCLGAP